MYLKTESSYVSGLVNMASSCSKQIGLSYVDADCFELKDYKKEFSKIYEINENELILEDLNLSFGEFLTNLFGENKDLIEGLIHWINFNIGKPNKLLTLKDNNILDKLSKDSPFYFIEDIFFIECEKIVICLLIGNDE